jgi:hypothetical protein
MFGLGKKQKQNSDDIWELGMRTMKSDLKNPNQEIHETINVPGLEPVSNKKEVASILVKNPVATTNQTPSNLPVMESLSPEQKASSIPENTVQESSLKLSEALEKKESYFSAKPKTQAENPVLSEKPSHKADINFIENSPQEKAPAAIPEKIKSEIRKREELTAAHVKGGGVNKILLALTAVVFLLTLSSGAYYYFFILNPQDETAKNVTPNPKEPATKPIENEIPKEKEIIQEISGPESLANASVISLVNSDLIASLGNTELDSRGTFFKIKNADSENIFTPSEIDALLKINLSEIEGNLTNSWVFFKKDSAGGINTGIIFESKDKTATNSSVLGIESELPARISGIFIGKTAPAIEGSVEFRNSAYDERARYFNFTPNDPAASIDWAMITSQGADYLIFANSKETMSMILSQIEEEPIENSMGQ